MSDPQTLCDECGRDVPEDESETCSCGAVVCDACLDAKHYRCNTGAQS